MAGIFYNRNAKETGVLRAGEVGLCCGRYKDIHGAPVGDYHHAGFLLQDVAQFKKVFKSEARRGFMRVFSRLS